MVAQTKKPAKQKQPKKHAPKTRVASQMRRVKIIQALIDGKNLTTAGIETGLNPKNASSQVTNILKEPQTQVTFNQLLDKAGLTDGKLAARIRELSEAKETKFFSEKGIVTDQKEVEALSIQADMIKFATKVKGHVIDRTRVETTQETYIDLTNYNININSIAKQGIEQKTQVIECIDVKGNDK